VQQFGRWPETVSTPSSGDMVATLQGYVSIMVHNDIRIDITIDRAIRLVNNRVRLKSTYNLVQCVRVLSFNFLFFTYFGSETSIN